MDGWAGGWMDVGCVEKREATEITTFLSREIKWIVVPFPQVGT